MTEREAVISGECRVETVPSSEGALLKGLRLELDLRLAPATADGKEGTWSILRVEGARFAPDRPAALPAYQRWSMLAGAGVLLLSTALWFALEPEPSEALPAAASAPVPPPAPTPPAPVGAPAAPIAPALAEASKTALPAPAPVQLASGPVVSFVPPAGALPTVQSGPRAVGEPQATKAVTVKRESAKPKVAAAPGSPVQPAAPRAPALASAAVAAAPSAPARPADVLDLFADTK